MLEGTAPGVSQFQSVLSDVISYVAFPVALIVEAQRYLLPLLFVIGLSVIIPIGLIFRAMPFTRGIGGTLIGIGIGISIIYPSMLIVLNYPVTNALQLSPFTSSYSCNYGIFCYAIDIVVNFIKSIVDMGLSFGVAAASLENMVVALNYITWYSVSLALQLVLFILDLGIGYSISNGIARLLGGNISLRITGKIKLA
jgi:hypothetical protein